MRERRAGRLALTGLWMCLLSCAGPDAERGSGDGVDFPEVDGWARAGEVLTYDADNLWEYINGAAELFVEFGVQTCRTADLVSGDITVTVDLYDMGTPLNAFGVYEREKPGDDVQVPGAAAGVLSPPYQALLLKGSTYAKVNTVEGELTDASGLALLGALASALPGETTPPPELDLLPAQGREGGSEGYKPLAYLGQDALSHCLYASYSLEGEESWEGFVVLPAAASTVWERVTAGWESVEHGGETIYFTEVPYSGLVGIVRRGEGIVGVAEVPDQATLLARLEGFGG